TMVVTMLLLSTLTGGVSPLARPTQFSTGDSSVPNDTATDSLFHSIWPSPVKDSAILDWFAAQIPLNYSILTQNQIGSKLGERTAPVFIFYQPHYQDIYADAILVDYNLPGLCILCLNSILASGRYVSY